MIVSFRHKGLRLLYEAGNARDLKPDQVRRIKRALFLLDNAERLDEIDAVPDMRLHPLTGNMRGLWSISVSGNWRIVFRFKDGNAIDVDLIDYH